MESEKNQDLWEKLRRVGKRGGQTTPVAAFWARNETAQPLTGGGGEENGNGPTLQAISSRKLAAALWELCQYRGGVTVVVPPPCLRRLKVNRHRSPPPISTHELLPESSSKLRRRVAESLAQHHRPIGKKPLAIPTASPTSYDSSKEISLSMPIESKGGKTSTELVKILKRIWRLEEQHVADTFLIKALKKELHRARSQHRADRNQLDQLVKLITEDKSVRKRESEATFTQKVHNYPF